MSNDLNLTRPSSRVSRPPGGGSSFSICKETFQYSIAPTYNVKLMLYC